MSPTARIQAEPAVEDPFDLDIVIIPGRTSAPPGEWNSGEHCHTDDTCPPTCESACGPSCTDGKDD